MRTKVSYFAASAARRLARRGLDCPSCGARGGTTVDRKALVTTLVRCPDCELLFRAPTTPTASSAAFYQRGYREGFTTELPDDATLRDWLGTGFAGSPKDYAPILAVLASAGVSAGARLFDLGCSWGYGSWQLARAGFEVDAFELSEPRAAFARDRLGVRVVDGLDAAAGPYDVFFSSHVLEHVPSVGTVLDLARERLAPGGLLVAFTPNGSEAHRHAAPGSWHRAWGAVHPNFLDDRFWRRRSRDADLLLSSSPHDRNRIERWAAGDPVASEPENLTGGELLALVRPT